MAGDLGIGSNRNNVDLNIVPFIDLMSCLTAFLLVTAVWVGTSQLETHPQGLAHDPTCPVGDCDEPKLSVLVENDRIVVGVSRLGEFERIERTHTERDWEQLSASLKKQKATAYFAHKDQIEVAGLGTPARPLQYQTLITAMDVAVQAGFDNVALTDAAGLSAQPY
jgi:biopolymer transport protein ExbD